MTYLDYKNVNLTYMSELADNLDQLIGNQYKAYRGKQIESKQFFEQAQEILDQLCVGLRVLKNEKARLKEDQS